MTQRSPLVGLHDDAIARLQFDHFIAQVDTTGPDGWPCIRDRLTEALVAAGSGMAVSMDRPMAAELVRIARRRRQLRELVEDVWRRHAESGQSALRSALFDAWVGLDATDRGRW